MRVLVQRVKKAAVIVNGRTISDIGTGVLLFVGIHKDDEPSDVHWMADKIEHLRLFEDETGKMNLNLAQVKGTVLSVPQFTLCADVQKGNRPGFGQAAPPATAKRMWLDFNNLMRETGLLVKEGEFGAHMEVQLTNEGPVTLWVDSRGAAS